MAYLTAFYTSLDKKLSWGVSQRARFAPISMFMEEEEALVNGTTKMATGDWQLATGYGNDKTLRRA